MAKNVERRLTLKTEVAGLREVTTLEEKLKKINQLVTDTQAKTTRYHGTALTQANNLLKVYEQQQKQLQGLLTLRRQLNTEEINAARRRNSQDFWAGIPSIAEIYRRYNLRSQLERRLEERRRQADIKREQSKEASEESVKLYAERDTKLDAAAKSMKLSRRYYREAGKYDKQAAGIIIPETASKTEKAKLTRQINKLKKQADSKRAAARKAAQESTAAKKAADKLGAAGDVKATEATDLATSAAGLESGAGGIAAGLGAAVLAAKVGKQLWTGMTATFRAITGMSFSIKGNFTAILEDVKKITDMYTGMATYATGTSLISNAAARQTQLQYGLTGGQAYAFDKTREMLGIRSDEDLLYMNQSQRAVFMQYMQRQEQLYAKLESSGALESIQRMQLEFSMFKQEMAADIMSFVADNKDTIIWVMKTSIVVLKGILQAIFKILSFFRISYSGNEYGMTSSMLSDTVAAGSSTSVTNKNINMTAHLNATGVLSSQEALQEYMRDALATEYRKTYEASKE